MTMIKRIIEYSVEHKLGVLTLIGVACIAGWWAMVTMPLDATPDLSDTQVIIYSHWDRSPDIVEISATRTYTSSLRRERICTGRARESWSISRASFPVCPRGLRPNLVLMLRLSDGFINTL
jgi:Cu/Ag efflux pump CusA